MIECTNFKSYNKGHLQGFADFYLPKWGIEIYGCSLYMKDGSRWLNLPSNEYINSEGEKKYAPFLRFREKKHWQIFMKQAKGAIDKWCEENPHQEPSSHTEEGDDLDEELPF